MAGFPLTGVDPNDPIPGILREIRFFQGATNQSGRSRDVVLLGNKVSSGTETVNTLGTVVLDQDDMIRRVGYRSELLLMHRKYIEIDPNANIYFIAIPEAGGSAAGTFTWTVTGPATAATTVRVNCIGESVEASVRSGDTAVTVAAAIRDVVNAQAFWPVTAAVGASVGVNDHVVTVTTANKGPRAEYALNPMRAIVTSVSGVAVAKSAVTNGTGVDSNTTALTVLDSADFYYQVTAQTTKGDGSAGNAAVAVGDAGVGDHAAFVASQSAPTVGKGCIVIFGLGATSSNATTVGLAANNIRCVFVHAINPEWTPAMLAARLAAIKRSAEVAYPSANLTNYGLGSGDLTVLPDPYTKTDRLTRTQIRNELNNGITPIGHTTRGVAYVVRQVTSACQVNATYDYRGREGHIPSAADATWDNIYASYLSQAQDSVAADPPAGQKPLKNVTYPNSLVAIIATELDRAIQFTAGPILDPGKVDEMKASITVQLIPGGLSARVRLFAVQHNNKGQFLFLESSDAA
jgi:phage tail sheath gpL-like